MGWFRGVLGISIFTNLPRWLTHEVLGPQFENQCLIGLSDFLGLSCLYWNHVLHYSVLPNGLEITPLFRQ